jgi:hypothetical protein
VALELFHPEISQRSCEDCRKYVFDDSADRDGRWTFKAAPKTFKRTGDKPIERAAGERTPCEKQLGACPKGHWTKPLMMSRKNRMAWIAYKRWKAVGNFPDDPIVARNAAIIADLEEQRRRVEHFELVSAMRLAGVR